MKQARFRIPQTPLPFLSRVVVLCGALLLGQVGCQRPLVGSEPPADQAVRSKIPHLKAPHLQNKRLNVQWADLVGRPVVFITHPAKRIIRSFDLLAGNRLLSFEGLRFVGLYHDAEYESYKGAIRYLRKKKDSAWLGFYKLSCTLNASNLFKENACTGVFRQIAEHATGIIFTGGPDIPPRLYGEKTSLLTEASAPNRNYWETSFFYHLIGRAKGPTQPDSSPIPLLARHPQLPVLGICMGLQTLNVAAGGTLYQDIPSEIYHIKTVEDLLKQPPDQLHRNPHKALDPTPGVWPGIFHRLKITKAGEPYWAQFNEEKPMTPKEVQSIEVMSIHHQAIKGLGTGLEVMATSTDGKVVEAVRHQTFVHTLGLQFHPEYWVLWNPSSKAKLHAAHPTGNYFAARLASHEPTRTLHKGIWRTFSNWIEGYYRNQRSRTDVPSDAQ